MVIFAATTTTPTCSAAHRRLLPPLLILCTPYFSILDAATAAAFITPLPSSSLITHSHSVIPRALSCGTIVKKTDVWPSPTLDGRNVASHLAMSSSPGAATALQSLPIADSSFWIGFYGLMQVALWIKIMTIRAVQPASTHELQNLAVNQDIRNLRATRAHGNYTENAPIFSLLLLVVDAMNSIPKLYVNLLGGLFFFGRIFHMMGMWASEGATLGRMAGAASTLLSLTLGSLMSIYSAIQVMGGISMRGLQVKLGIVATIVAIGNLFAGAAVEKKE